MQIINLPRGGQKGIKGCVVNVPSNLCIITNILPRLLSNCGLVPVKLRRKLKYKEHSMCKSIRPENVLKALQCHKEANRNYKDVKVDDDWIQQCNDENEELFKQIFENVPEWKNLDQSNESFNNVGNVIHDADNITSIKKNQTMKMFNHQQITSLNIIVTMRTMSL